MFIPPNRLKDSFDPTPNIGSKVRLKSSHLLIDHEVASEIFGSDLNAHIVYYSDRLTLLVAAKSDELFKKLHKAKQHMLKGRNLKGDKTIALHELLIDNEIDDTDRDLAFEFQPGLGILNIKL